MRLIGICLYAEKLVLALAGCRRGEFRRYRSVLFCYATEKYQKNAPKGTNLRFAPSGLPHSRHGLAVAGVTLIGARIRRGSVRIALPRLCYSTALSPLGLAGGVLKAFFLNLWGRLLGSTSACVRMAAYRGEARREMLEKVSFGQKNCLKRTLAEPRKPHLPPESPISRPQASFFRLQAPFFARKPHFSLASPISRPPCLIFRLISLHERRSRNMTAHIEGRELSVLSNLIPAVKRSPKTSFER